MKFNQQIDRDLNIITAQSDNAIAVNGEWHEQGLIVQPTRPPIPWPIATFPEFASGSLDLLRADPPDIVLVGTGARHQLAGKDLMQYFAGLPFPVELMTTQAACRTYNLIAHEGRAVAACLIVEGNKA